MKQTTGERIVHCGGRRLRIRHSCSFVAVSCMNEMRFKSCRASSEVNFRRKPEIFCVLRCVLNGILDKTETAKMSVDMVCLGDPVVYLILACI